jgi:ribosomal protein S2
MRRYIIRISKDGTPLFDLRQTYEKIKLAAKVIAGIPNIADVYAISSRANG